MLEETLTGLLNGVRPVRGGLEGRTGAGGEDDIACRLMYGRDEQPET